MFYILRILPKPGMTLVNEDNYMALLLHAGNLTSKTPTVNITINEKKFEDPAATDKENERALVADKAMGKGEKRYILLI